VQCVTAGVSIPVMFETYYVREAAHRVLAADPHCLEVGIGCARERNGDPKKIYVCICFIQVNEKPVHDGQEKAFRNLKSEARSTMDPELIRRLALWGREKASMSVVKAALRHDDGRVRGAGLDAWLLLDEEKARKEIAERFSEAARRHSEDQLGKAYAILAALGEVTYDRRIEIEALESAGRALQSALKQLEAVERLPEEERERARRELERRLKGIPLEEAAEED
jgi:hypothetical protein